MCMYVAMEVLENKLHMFLVAQELLNDWVQGQLHTLDDHTTEAAIWSDDEDINHSNFEPSIQSIIQQTDAGALSMEGKHIPV